MFMHPLIQRFLKQYPLMEWFSSWDPQLTGSYLMELEIESSDIDFSFLIEDWELFVREIQAKLGPVKIIKHTQYIECIKQFEGKSFSLFAPLKMNDILLIRQQYFELAEYVKTLSPSQKDIIRQLKKKGLKTPQAIAEFKKALTK